MQATGFLWKSSMSLLCIWLACIEIFKGIVGEICFALGIGVLKNVLNAMFKIELTKRVYVIKKCCMH